jgi:hypothetical protein
MAIKFKINDRVMIAASADSADAKYNGEIGHVTRLVQDWFVETKVNGKVLRFKPSDLKLCPAHL